MCTLGYFSVVSRDGNPVSDCLNLKQSQTVTDRTFLKVVSVYSVLSRYDNVLSN